ncbi:MAG: hypothetical protein K2X66_17700 [Cyanobacteria bacterium]|nr:hypothetical protein [Cyanobacteriota bacterium]
MNQQGTGFISPNVLGATAIGGSSSNPGNSLGLVFNTSSNSQYLPILCL